MPTCADAIILIADIEQRQTIIARNTGEILKIYLLNEERLKRIKDLETDNVRLQGTVIDIQNKFMATNDVKLRTQLASEFFILKATIQSNQKELEEISRD